MRFARYLDDGLETCGVVDGDTLVPLDDSATLLELIREGGMTALLREGQRALASPLRKVSATPVSSVRLLPPFLPPSFRDFSAFEEHVAGIVAGLGSGVVPPEWYDAPVFYFSNPHTFIGAHDEMPIPPDCELFDFELEVAAVVGRTLVDPTPEEAADAIVGYLVLNDWSARDVQQREMRVNLGPSKGKDFGSTLGPWLVTADEFEGRVDAEGRLDLRMTVAVNGDIVGENTLASMSWTFGELIAHAGRTSRLLPGDLIGSGTCGNGGCLAELWGRNGERTPPPLQPGDVVTMTVEGIGTLENRVIPTRVGSAAVRRARRGPAFRAAEPTTIGGAPQG